ncbi:hypothetical protein ABZ297_08945 [Nonomuraea sp. NPDC005983]|uniref:hypothetical protein n=1 Tax=Nonomuraea sp. NPDC005983 TaxID=3155595 RepID=UPI0033AB6B3D
MSLELPGGVRMALALTGIPAPDCTPESLLGACRRLIGFTDAVHWQSTKATAAGEQVRAGNSGGAITAMRTSTAGEDGAPAQTREIVRAALATATGQASGSFLMAALKVSLAVAAVILFRRLKAAGFFGAAGRVLAEAAIKGIGALIRVLLRTTYRLLSAICRWLFERAGALLARRRAARLARPPLPKGTAAPSRAAQPHLGKPATDAEQARAVKAWEQATAKRRSQPAKQPDNQPGKQGGEPGSEPGGDS